MYDIVGQPDGDGIGETTAPPQVDPPVSLLRSAAAVVAASLVCWLLGWRGAFDDPTPIIALYVAGYVMATIVGLGLTAAFARTDQRRRQRSTYSPRQWLGTAQNVVAVACIAAAAANVWNLATLLA